MHILFVSIPQRMPRKKLTKFLKVNLKKEGGEKSGVAQDREGAE